MQTPYWNPEHYRLQALAAWNLRQPAWTPIKRYDQLTPAQQSEVDQHTEELEFAALMVDTAASVDKMDC